MGCAQSTGQRYGPQVNINPSARDLQAYPQKLQVSSEDTKVCCISMNRSDILRLLACPPELIKQLRTCILVSWGNIQREMNYYGSHEFKLVGRPWDGNGIDAVNSRRLLAALLTVMARNGWNLIQATDVSKKEGDKDTLFFERGVEEADATLFAVSFNRGDTIRVIDAPQFMPYLVHAVQTFWPKGIQHQREYGGSLEMKLRGFPWYPWGQDAVNSKLILAQILANFKSVGYKLYASVDISRGDVYGNNNGWSYDGDLESWVFRKVTENWK